MLNTQFTRVFTTIILDDMGVQVCNMLHSVYIFVSECKSDSIQICTIESSLYLKYMDQFTNLYHTQYGNAQ